MNILPSLWFGGIGCFGMIIAEAITSSTIDVKTAVGVGAAIVAVTWTFAKGFNVITSRIEESQTMHKTTHSAIETLHSNQKNLATAINEIREHCANCNVQIVKKPTTYFSKKDVPIDTPKI